MRDAMLMLLLLAGSAAAAEPTDVIWAGHDSGTGDDRARAVATTDDGTAVVVGSFEGSAEFGGATSVTSIGGEDAFIARYAGNGELLWVRQGAGGADDRATCVAVLDDGSIIVGGEFRGEFTLSYGEDDAQSQLATYGLFFARYTADGDLQWLKRVQTGRALSADDLDAFPDGSFVVTGAFSYGAQFGPGEPNFRFPQTGDTAPEIFIARYNADGTFRWVETPVGLPGRGDRGLGICTHDDGTLSVGGYFMGEVVFGADDPTPIQLTAPSISTEDAFVARYDANGLVQWATSVSGVSSNYVNGVASTPDGGVVVAGEFRSSATFGPERPIAERVTLTSAGLSDIFVAKVTHDGRFDWIEKAGGTNEDIAKDVDTDAAGTAYVTGHYEIAATFGDDTTVDTGETPRRALFTAGYGADGELRCLTALQGTSEGHGVSATPDGSVTVGFHTDDVTIGGTQLSPDEEDALRFRIGVLPTAAQLVWGTGPFMRNEDETTGVALNPDGSVTAMGTMENPFFPTTPLSFTTPYTGTNTLPLALRGGNANHWIVRYTAGGDASGAPDGIDWVTMQCGTSPSAIDTFEDYSTVIAGNFSFGQATFVDQPLVDANADGLADVNGFVLRSTADPLRSFKAYVSRYHGDGQLDWAQMMPERAHISADGVVVRPDQDIVVAGAYDNGEADDFAAYTSLLEKETGNPLWSTVIAEVTRSATTPQAALDSIVVSSLPDDGCVVAMRSYDGPVRFGGLSIGPETGYSTALVRVSHDGVPQRAHVFGTRAEYVDIAGLSDGSFVLTCVVWDDIDFGDAVAGNSDPQNEGIQEAGDREVFVVRFDQEMKVHWVRRFGGEGTERSPRISALANGELVLAFTTSSGDFSVGYGSDVTVPDANEGFGQVVTLALSANGNVVWARTDVESVTGTTLNDMDAGGSGIAMGGGGADTRLGIGDPVSAMIPWARPTTSTQGGRDSWIGRYALPVSAQLSAVEQIAASCEPGQSTATVSIPFELSGSPPAGSALTVRDTTGDRLLFSSPATPGRYAPSASFPLGASTVSIEVKSNDTVLASRAVSIQVADTTPPVLQLPGDRTLECTGMLTRITPGILGVTATDDCDSDPEITLMPDELPLGGTGIEITATDASGNTTTDTLTVTIVDTSAPAFLEFPGDIEVTADDDCDVTVAFDLVAWDACGVASVTCEATLSSGTTVSVDPSGTDFPVGTSVVACRAADPSGNDTVREFNVIVTDATAPMVELGIDADAAAHTLVSANQIEVSKNEPGECFAFVEFTITATDNCDGDPTITCTAPWGVVEAGDAFPVGSTDVSCEVTDESGNSSTLAFSVIVLDDELPVVTYYDQRILQTDALGTPITITPDDFIVSATDNCGEFSVYRCEPPIVPVGITSVNLRITDLSGNERLLAVTVEVVLPNSAETTVGQGVDVTTEVQNPDGEGEREVVLAFENVTAPGVTTVESISPTEPIPDGFVVPAVGLYFDVSTTATFAGEVELCFSWEEGEVDERFPLFLYHFEDDAWVDVTSSVDLDENRICGGATSFSPFAIVQPVYEFSGFRAPIKDNGRSLFKRGRVLPIRFKLRDQDGNRVKDAEAVLRLHKISDTPREEESEIEIEVDPEPLFRFNRNNEFRYGKWSGNYIYLMRTDNLSRGTYRITVLLDDGTQHSVNVSFR